MHNFISWRVSPCVRANVVGPWYCIDGCVCMYVLHYHIHYHSVGHRPSLSSTLFFYLACEYCSGVQADVLPTVHGSGMFTRGETQTLATVALGPPADAHPQR